MKKVWAKFKIDIIWTKDSSFYPEYVEYKTCEPAGALSSAFWEISLIVGVWQVCVSLS